MKFRLEDLVKNSKKRFREGFVGLAAMSSLSALSCSNDKNPSEPKAPVIPEDNVPEMGVYIENSGNESNITFGNGVTLNFFSDGNPIQNVQVSYSDGLNHDVFFLSAPGYIGVVKSKNLDIERGQNLDINFAPEGVTDYLFNYYDFDFAAWNDFLEVNGIHNGCGTTSNIFEATYKVTLSGQELLNYGSVCLDIASIASGFYSGGNMPHAVINFASTANSLLDIVDVNLEELGIPSFDVNASYDVYDVLGPQPCFLEVFYKSKKPELLENRIEINGENSIEIFVRGRDHIDLTTRCAGPTEQTDLSNWVKILDAETREIVMQYRHIGDNIGGDNSGASRTFDQLPNKKLEVIVEVRDDTCFENPRSGNIARYSEIIDFSNSSGGEPFELAETHDSPFNYTLDVVKRNDEPGGFYVVGFNDLSDQNLNVARTDEEFNVVQPYNDITSRPSSGTVRLAQDGQNLIIYKDGMVERRNLSDLSLICNGSVGGEAAGAFVDDGVRVAYYGSSYGEVKIRDMGEFCLTDETIRTIHEPLTDIDYLAGNIWTFTGDKFRKRGPNLEILSEPMPVEIPVSGATFLGYGFGNDGQIYVPGRDKIYELNGPE